MPAPVVFLKTGHFPLAYGILGGIRSASRLGCDTYAYCDSPRVPYALSRSLTAPVLAVPSLEQLLELGRRIGPAVLIAVSDGAAVMVDDQRNELSAVFFSPEVPTGLPRMVANKALLGQVAADAGIPAPRTALLGTWDRGSDAFAFPVVVKTSEQWRDVDARHVLPTRIIRNRHEMEMILAQCTENEVVVQDYLPPDGAEDWIVNAYVDGGGSVLYCGTARKYRSWLPGTGVACMARAEPNAVVKRQALQLIEALEYRGLVDMDFRLDPRDRHYKLLDFNPRLGAAAAMFHSVNGLDLVQIAVLDLLGATPGWQEQRFGVRLVVENMDAPARVLTRTRVGRRPGERIVHGWWDSKDPLPFAGMVPWQIRQWADQVRWRVSRRAKLLQLSPVAEDIPLGASFRAPHQAEDLRA